MDAKLDKRPIVDQQSQPLTRGQLLLRMLCRDLLVPASLLDLLPASAKILGQRPQQAGGRGVSRHRSLSRHLPERAEPMALGAAGSETFYFLLCQPRAQASRTENIPIDPFPRRVVED